MTIKRRTIAKTRASVVQSGQALQDLGNENPNKILFSFAKFTTHKNYGFRSKSANAMAYANFLDKLRGIGDKSWDLFTAERKQIGYETMPIGQLNRSFVGSLHKTIDTSGKLCVSRFNGEKMRFVFVRDTGCRHLMHILGIDWDLSLYEH